MENLLAKIWQYLLAHGINKLALILNERDIADDSLGGLLSCFFLESQIALEDSDKIFTKDAKNAENLNTFFWNKVKNRKIPESEEVNLFAENLSHVTLKAIFRYSKHPSFIATNNVTIGRTFQFLCVSVDDVSKEIEKNSARLRLHSLMTFLLIC